MMQTKHLLLSFLISLLSLTAFSQRTIHVEDGKIYSACKEEVVMRGVNEMFIWSQDKEGVTTLPEIALTGSNTVRLVWTTEGTPAELDALIANCLKENMIPVPELHDATGDFSQLQKLLDYWKRPEILAIIQKYKQWIIVNIGNEVGNNETSSEWEAYYTDAITQLRDAGIDTPLMIDCGSYGSKESDFLEKGENLLSHDPLSNIIFAVHTYWFEPATDQGKMDRLDDMIASAQAKKLPFIIGEGPQKAASPWGDYCDVDFPYAYLIQRCQEEGIGWLSWSWGLVDNNDCGAPNSVFDLTTDGTYGNWATTFAEEIMETSQYSVKNTSIIPTSMTNENCGSQTCAPILLETNSQNICLTGSTELTLNIDNTNKTIAWFKDNIEIEGENLTSLTASETGYYRVEVDSISLCTVFDDMYINNTMHTSIGDNKIICESASVQIDASLDDPSYNLEWSLDGTHLEELNDQASITVEETGGYAVRVYSSFCEAKDSITVSSLIPEMNDTTVCKYNATLSSQGNENYVWYTDDAFTTKAGEGLSVNVQQTETQTYYVRSESSFIGQVGKEELGELVWNTWNEESKGYRLGFQVFQDITITSVDLYSDGVGSLKVVIYDANQQEVNKHPFTLAKGKNTLNINNSLSPGIYFIGVEDSDVHIKLNSNDAGHIIDYSSYVLMHENTNVIAIDRTYPSWIANEPWYLFFYNWQIEIPNAQKCLGSPVTVSVKEDGCTLNLEDINAAKQLLMYPNPTNSTVSLNKPMKWTLTNTHGKNIATGYGTEINLQELPNGLYLISTDEGVTKIQKQ